MLERFEDLLTSLFTWVAMTVQVIMAVIVTYAVFTRYFLSYTPAWGEEGALLCMVWFGFLSIAIGVRDNLHLSMDIIDRFMPRRFVPPLELFKYVVMLLIGVFMAYQGSIMVEVGSWNKLPGLKISSAFIYLVVPLSGSAIVLYCVSAIIGIVKTLGGRHERQ